MATGNIQSIRLRNFKRFESFFLATHVANILVGPNNSGKSSILDALRVAHACLRYTRSRSPTPIQVPNEGIVLGYQLPAASMPIPIANITTNYNEEDAVIEIRCDNKNSLIIKLHPDRPIVFYAKSEKDSLRSSTLFRAAIPIDLIIVPPLGPLEETEIIFQDETVRRNESSRLANRYFRNIWWRKDENEWHDMQALLTASWPGIDLKKPELIRTDRAFIQMFYREGRGEHELYWAGFGFQVWLQMLSHILRGTARSILVLDEPDIYLHPDLQRKLLRIVRERFGQFFMATHSVEIINEGQAGDVISVRSNATGGKRILTDEDYQALFSYIGSVENIDFSRLGRARRLVFFEGNDKRLLKKFAQKVGANDFVNDIDTLVLQSGGFSQWKRVKEVTWTFKNVLKLDIDVFTLFDRDYRSPEEMEKFLSGMNGEGIQCFALERKEIENYALSRELLIRTIQRRQDQRLIETQKLSRRQIERLISVVSELFKHDTHSQIATHRAKFFQTTGSRLDPSTILRQANESFDRDWADIDRRLTMLGGKDFIAQLSARLQKTKNFSLTINMLIDEMSASDVPADLVQILRRLNDFCKR